MFTVAILFIALKILIAQRLKVLDRDWQGSLALLTAPVVVWSVFSPEKLSRFVAEVSVGVTTHKFCRYLGFAIRGLYVGCSSQFYQV